MGAVGKSKYHPPPVCGVGCGGIPGEWRIARVWTFIGTTVDVCALNGDDPLRAAIKSNPKMDNTSVIIVVPAIFAWLDASVLDYACTQRLLALVS